jgi:drug/metabolite transporter (DMT)-like permease
MSYFYLFFSVLVISQAPNWVKLSQAGYLPMILWRTLFAGLILSIVSFYKQKIPELKKLKKAEIKTAFTIGIVLFVHYIFWFLGVKKTSVANSALIFATNPVYTAFLGFFLLKETISKTNILVFIICLLGCFITFYPNLKFSSDAFLGDIMVLISAILFSLYIVLTKKMRLILSNEPLTAIINLICAGLSVIVVIISNQFTSTPENLIEHSQRSWLSFILMAIFSSVLGHSLFTHCLKYFNINVMSTTMLMNPIWASLTAYLLYGEMLNMNNLVGFFFISAGLFILYLPGIKDFLSRIKSKPVL